MVRKFLPTFSELIDRLTIHQLKEVFITERKETYGKEMKHIVNDLDHIIKEKDIKISGDLIRAVVVLAQINAHIWYNESKVRQGKDDQDLHLLKLTHGLNGIRNRSQNFISSLIGPEERLDWKTDCLAEEFKDWKISMFGEGDKQDDEGHE
ncbi:MAG: hypothetical protein ACTSSP_02105 [Candidatus Asgardarchaeia archaeon]